MLELTKKALPPDFGAGRAPADGDILDLKRMIDVLWRRRMVVIATTVLFLAAGFGYLILAPAKYTAITSIVIDTKRFQLQGDLIAETAVDQAAVESQIQTIKSEAVARNVVKSLNLTDDAEFAGVAESFLRQLILALGLDTAAGPVSDEAMSRRAIARFRSMVDANRVGKSYVVGITFTSLDPNKAARIANEVAEAYIVDQLDARFQASQRASLWLQQRIGDLRDQASSAFRAVQDYKMENNIIDTSGKLNSELELDELASALARARAETSQAKAKLDRITSVVASNNHGALGVPDQAVADALNNQVIVRLRQQYLDAQKQEAEYSNRYGRTHTAVVNLRNEMAGLQRAIWDEVQRIAETYKSEYEIARSREQAIEKRVTEVFQQSSGTRQAQVKLRELETTAQTYRTLYENFLNRYTQAVQQATFPSTEARVITPASPPDSKSSPRTGLTLLAALIGGMGLGVGAAFAVEGLDRVVRTRQQLERDLRLVSLGTLPLVDGSASPLAKIWAQFGGIGRRSASSRWKHRDARGPGPRPLVLTGDDPFSQSAETLRAVKVAVDLDRGVSVGKIVAFTSAIPGEGKTTVTSSLAAMIAHTGKRVLVIDGDLRNPALTESFAPQSRIGLVDVLAGRVSLQEGIAADAHRGFELLAGPLGLRLAHTADVLASPSMKETLDSCREIYDYILVDLPPMLPLVDVQAAAHMFDAYVLVTEWGRTTLHEVERAVSLSPLLAERLLGVVLNKVDVRAMRRFEGYVGRSVYPYYGAGAAKAYVSGS
jgi:exopolysaccharide transport family protein